MTPVGRSSSTRQEFEQLLSAALRRVHLAAWRAQIPGVGDRALLLLVAVAGVYALLRWVCFASGQHVPIGWGVYILALVFVLIVPASVTLSRAYGRLPSLSEAAERLDLGTSDHNRIAIGLALVDCRHPSPFVRAAVDDGIATLRRLRDEPPELPPMSFNWQRSARLAGLVVGLTLVAGLSGRAAGSLAPGPAGPGAVAGAPVDRSVSERFEPEHVQPAKPVTWQDRTSTPSGQQVSTTVAAASQQAEARNEPPQGRPGVGSTGQAQPAHQSAKVAGDSSNASATSSSHSNEQGKRTSAKRGQQPRIAQRNKRAEAGESSGVSQGASGGGSASPTYHDWSQRDQSAEGMPEEEETDEEVEDERESSTQRGGVQPSLKDRREAPSRELGISGEGDTPGTGRGGPTPPKKSRGTASLVLGVPVPDFVRGRMGPGPTKLTHERVEPYAMPGDPATPAGVKARSLPESPCRRFEIPPGFEAIVRDYLIALHSAAGAGDTTGEAPASTSPIIETREE